MANKTQCETILEAMIENKGIDKWTAKDFQNGKYFVGYEATARMSDLVRMYPDLFIVGKDGRFRTLSIDWQQEELIDLIRKCLEGLSEE